MLVPHLACVYTDNFLFRHASKTICGDVLDCWFLQSVPRLFDLTLFGSDFNFIWELSSTTRSTSLVSCITMAAEIISDNLYQYLHTCLRTKLH